MPATGSVRTKTSKVVMVPPSGPDTPPYCPTKNGIDAHNEREAINETSMSWLASPGFQLIILRQMDPSSQLIEESSYLIGRDQWGTSSDAKQTRKMGLSES